MAARGERQAGERIHRDRVGGHSRDLTTQHIEAAALEQGSLNLAIASFVGS